MKNYNAIVEDTNMRQGTSKYDTPISAYIQTDYFKSEPRSTLYWLTMIRSLSSNIESYGAHWNDLLPNNLSNILIAEYINDPRGTIANGRFTADEINELRQPQRIMLFYFLKKMATFEEQNNEIIRNTNNAISRVLFQLEPLAALPDSGYVVLYNNGEDPVEIVVGEILEAVIQGEPVTRKYTITSALIGDTMLFDQFIVGFPDENTTSSLILSKETLPLESQIAPFRTEEVTDFHHEFVPSLIISSSLLYLSQGMRTIYLTLKGETILNLESNQFVFQITTEDGWVSMPNGTTILLEDCITLEDGYEFIFKIDVECEPIAPFNIFEEVETNLSNKTGIKVSYKEDDLDAFKVSEVNLKVAVEGLLPTAIRNQDQVLNSKDNFMPFGLDALLQSVFSFTHIELTNPYLEEISLQPIWASKPKYLTNYYKAYDKKEKNFKVAVRTVFKAKDAVSYTALENLEAELFNESIKFNSVIVPSFNLSGNSSWDTEELDPLVHDLYYQLELNVQDFGERQYPLLMSNYAIELAAYESSFFNRIRKKPTEVNMPYTPEMSELNISYTSKTVSWDVTAEDNEIQVYKNAPLGYSSYSGEAINLGYDANGLLYLGFSNLTSDSTGNLYFNGPSGNPRAKEATIDWWYLSSEGWSSLKNNILTDSTFGLTQTGLFNFSTPEDIVNYNSLMPRGFFWLKATITPVLKDKLLSKGNECVGELTSFQESIMKLDGVFANAMAITRQQEELDESDNVTYLAAGTELYFEEPETEYIVELPFHTDGEVAKESRLCFWTRAFNRVRNRGRMVEDQDFEDLILNYFRNLILVKCIPRKSRSKKVEVVVVNEQFYGSNVPYAIPPINSKTQLETIRNEMLPLTSPFFRSVLNLEIVNPVYQPIGFLIHLKFDLDTNASEDENKQRVYNDLQYFINPWFFEKYQIPKFGCWFDYASIASYLQSQSYIAAVLDVKMGISDGENLEFPEEFEFQEDEILILTEPNIIIVVNDLEGYEQNGIDEMIIGEDFYIANTKGEKIITHL